MKAFALGVLVVAVAVLGLRAGPAFAAHVQCGQTITVDTTLDSDLVDCPLDGIVIGAAGVTLDLNGHTLDGDDMGTGPQGGVYVNSSGATVRNGRIKEFESGVFVVASNVLIEQLAAVDNALYGVFFFSAQDSRVERTRTTGNSVGIGLRLTGRGSSSDGNVVVRNRVQGNEGNGIFLEGPFAPDFAGVTNTLVEGNIANGNGANGIENGAPTTKLGANSANGNVALGVKAVAGTADRGANAAQGNGDPAQCTNVSCDRSRVPLFGKRSAGESSSAMSSRVKRVSPFPFFFSGTVKKLSVFLDGQGGPTGSQVMRGVIYANQSSGGPGRLLARTFQATIAAGSSGHWVDLYFPFPPRLSPGVYWLGIHSGATGGVARFAWDSVTSSRFFNIDEYGDGPSSPFGPASVDNQQISIFASGTY